MSQILIADDQLAMRNMFSSIFSSTDHQVDLAVDGKDAFSKASKNHYDLIISDLYMPGYDGIELTGKLRSLSNCSGTPILIVSTEGASQKKAEGRSAGANGWIVKPISAEILLPAIKRLLN